MGGLGIGNSDLCESSNLSNEFKLREDHLYADEHACGNNQSQTDL